MTNATQRDRALDRQREADRHELGTRAAIALANEAADPAHAVRDRCRPARMHVGTTTPFVPMARCVHPGCEQTASGLRTDGRCHYHGAQRDGRGCTPFHGISGRKGTGRRGRPPKALARAVAR
jgi:hypothetical protein